MKESYGDYMGHLLGQNPKSSTQFTTEFGLANDGLSAATQQRVSARIQYKRLMDIAVAVPLSIILVPLLALIATLICLDSPGSPIFAQRRRGQHGQIFRILKFRTMRVMEDGDQIVQSYDGDPRVTRLGRLLRRTCIDELPQLVNVIKGDMSLVGPRPHALAHDRHYAALIPDYIFRQSLKPGLTGWSQAHGFRGKTPTLEDMRNRIMLDIWYVENASLMLDLRILGLTVMELCRNRSAI